VLIVAEIALSVALVAGAALLARTFIYLRPADPGFDPTGKLAFTLSLPRSRYPDAAAARRAIDRLRERLLEQPDIRAAATTSYLPLSGFINTADVQPDGNGDKPITVGAPIVTPDYLPEMGITVLRGRGFQDADRAGGPDVALVNEALARRLWGTNDPLGRRVVVKVLDRTSTKTVVGVVRDTRSRPHRLGGEPELFLSAAQNPSWVVRFVLRTPQPSAVLAPPVRRIVAELDPLLPVGEVEPVAAITTVRSMAQWRFAASLLGAFAGVAITLAAVGLFAVIGCWVAERTPEMGVRMALGASAAQVRRIFVGRGALLTASGLAVGLGLAAMTTRFLESWLVGVTPRDAVSFSLAAALVAIACITATAIAARRATSIDPLTAIRQ
jgi:predicted permease